MSEAKQLTPQVLAMYLGCKIQRDGGIVPGIQGELSAIDARGFCTLKLSDEIGQNIGCMISEVKPILRRFQDMTEQEAHDIAELGTRFEGRTKFQLQSLDVTSLQAYIRVTYTTVTKLNSGDRTDNWHEQIVIGSDSIYKRDFKDWRDRSCATNEFQITAFLLSKSFDLFNLIDSGLAIDEATLNPDKP